MAVSNREATSAAGRKVLDVVFKASDAEQSGDNVDWGSVTNTLAAE